MKNALLLHGTGGNDKDYFWFEDTKKYLELNGYKVWWPLLPSTNSPTLAQTSDFIKQNSPVINEQTIIIAHSSACPVILSMMQDFTVKVRQVVLVAGYYQKISNQSVSMLPKSFNWDEIKTKSAEFILINSDNDPWGCNDKQARPIAQKLDAKFVFAEGQGHMGSGMFKQPYKEFSLLKEAINL